MKSSAYKGLTLILLLFQLGKVSAQAPHPEAEFKVFQFPSNQIPRIDGDISDWAMVPESYVVATKDMWDDTGVHPKTDATTPNIKVKVGWVKGENRLYFLYEAEDNYWQFTRPGLEADIFELVVDGDRSGGSFIDRFYPFKDVNKWDAFFAVHGVHAQNYHIFTPPGDKDWAMVWGCQPWIKQLPYANAAYNYTFKEGEKGKLILEFFITPFDYAGTEPARSIPSVLSENKKIGLCWAVIDFDDVNSPDKNGFWNLSSEHKMYGQADFLRSFRLMPLEGLDSKKLAAKWSFTVLDMNRRLVAFQDESTGEISHWNWSFGDGTTSTEQHPQHAYKEAGNYIVTLMIDGAAGTSKLTKVWDVTLK